MRTRRISPDAAAERDLRARAEDDAADLFATHGHAALAIVADRMVDQSRSVTERRCDRLTLLAVERLERAQRQARSPTALVIWKPPLFSMAGLAALFGLKSRRR